MRILLSIIELLVIGVCTLGLIFTSVVCFSNGSYVLGGVTALCVISLLRTAERIKPT